MFCIYFKIKSYWLGLSMQNVEELEYMFWIIWSDKVGKVVATKRQMKIWRLSKVSLGIFGELKMKFWWRCFGMARQLAWKQTREWQRGNQQQKDKESWWRWRVTVQCMEQSRVFYASLIKADVWWQNRSATYKSCAVEITIEGPVSRKDVILRNVRRTSRSYNVPRQIQEAGQKYNVGSDVGGN